MTEQTDQQKDPLLEEQLTQLVSYLDGELDGTQITDLEQSLVTDSAMRSHVDILSRTWSLLDELDDVQVSESFTQQTMATIATQTVTAEPTQQKNGLMFSLKALVIHNKVLFAFVIGMLGGSLGLMAGQLIQHQAIDAEGSEAAVDELIIEHMDLLPRAGLYEMVPDAGTLRKLQLDVQPGPGERQ